MYKKIRSAYCAGEISCNSSLPEFLAGHENFDEWFNRTVFVSADGKHYNKMYHTFGSADDQTVFCKYYRHKQIAEKLYDDLTGSSRARRAHKRILRMQELGINTPDSLGYLRSTSRSYLFLRVIDGFNDLRHYREPQQQADRLPLRTLLRKALQQLVLLHDAGYCHGDFKWPNILCNEASGEILVIDFDGVRYQPNKRLPRSYIKDMARFLVSLREGGLADEIIAYALQTYAELRGLRLDTIERAVKPRYESIVKKHALKQLAA